MSRKPGRVAGLLAIGMLAASATVVSAAGAGANWSSGGQNIQNTRHNAGETKLSPSTVGGLERKWVLATAGDVSATPAVDGSTVYVPDFAGNLYAVDRRTGAVRWQKNFVTDYGLPSDPATGFVDHARATPAISGDLLIIGDQVGKMNPFVSEGNVLGIDKRTGALRWRTRFADVAPIVTQSAVVHDGVAYVGVASFEELWARFLPPSLCCFFRGSIMALDVSTGAILWRTYTAPPPDPAGPPNDGYTGNAVWGSTPAVDVARGQLYVATGNNYSVPAALQTCIDSAVTPEDAQDCVDPANHFDSVMALDLDTGEINWVTRALPIDAWNVSCGIPFIFEEVTPNCPDDPGPDWDFGQGPALFTIRDEAGKRRDLVGAGQKSGVYWALDPATGAVVWSTQVSPGGLAGGLQWGSATDGTRVYVGNSNSGFAPWTLTNGDTVYWGGWSALDARTGAIVWEEPDPAMDRGMGPVSSANGVVYACSMSPTGTMYARDAATGDVLWSYDSGASCLGGAAISNGQVFWGTGYDAFSFAPDGDQALFAFGLPD